MEVPESYSQIATIGGDLARPLAGTRLVLRARRQNYYFVCFIFTKKQVPMGPDMGAESPVVQ